MFVSISGSSVELRHQVDDSSVNSSGYGTYTSSGQMYKIYEISTPYAFTDLIQLKFTQSRDILTIVHPKYEVRDLIRSDHDDWVLSVVSFISGVKVSYKS